jgi:hypothetical protein
MGKGSEMKKAAKKSSKADSLAAKRIADAEKAEQAKGVTNVEPQDVVTYASQKAALRREYESKLREAETELARRYAKDAKKFLAEHIEGSKDEVLKGLWSDYVEASRHSDGGVVTQSSTSSSEGGERRTRRSAETAEGRRRKDSGAC